METTNVFRGLDSLDGDLEMVGRRDNRGLLRLRNGGEDDGLLRAGRREIDGGGADWAVSGRRRDVGPCRWRWI